MTGQRRPDELIRILRAEFITKPGGVPGGGAVCVTFTCGATGWRGAGGTIVRTLVHETAFQLDTGGNARGANSIDLQHNRSNAVEVAAGTYCFIHGQDNRIDPQSTWNFIFGYNNDLLADGNSYIFTVGSNNSFPEGGFGWGASAATVFGVGNTVYDSCESSMIVGDNNDIAGTRCFIVGDLHNDNSLTEDCMVFGHNNNLFFNTGHCILFGSFIELTHARFVYAFGNYVKSNDVAGQYYYKGRIVWSSGARANLGDNQSSKFSQNLLVTNWTVAWLTGFQFPIPVDTVWTFGVVITGTESGCANSYSWKMIEGVIENDGGNCTILAAPTVTNIYRDVATKEWQAVADNVNDRLAIQYRDTAGPDGTDCNITITLESTEVAFA